MAERKEELSKLTDEQLSCLEALVTRFEEFPSNQSINYVLSILRQSSDSLCKQSVPVAFDSLSRKSNEGKGISLLVSSMNFATVGWVTPTCSANSRIDISRILICSLIYTANSALACVMVFPIG